MEINQCEISEELRLKLGKNVGHISSLLFQDPDTLIFENEYQLFGVEEEKKDDE